MKHIGVVNGRHCCYTTRYGIDRHYLGCAHETPRQALSHTVPVYVPASRSALEGQGFPASDGTAQGQNEASGN